MSASRTYTYSRGHRLLEVASIVLFFALLLHLGWRAVQGTSTPWGWAALGLAGLIGYLGADLLSGIIHWGGDTVGDERTPLVGKNFITHFRTHHVDPKAITRHDFVETNGNNCIVSLSPLAAADVLLPAVQGFGLFACSVVGFVTLFVFGTNQFHKWAHADDPPRVVRLLQRMRLILPPGHHQIHHTAPHDTYYCITVGWMNPLLARIRFFRALEWMLAKVRPDLLYLEERRAFLASHGARVAR